MKVLGTFAFKSMENVNQTSRAMPYPINYPSSWPQCVHASDSVYLNLCKSVKYKLTRIPLFPNIQATNICNPIYEDPVALNFKRHQNCSMQAESCLSDPSDLNNFSTISL